jgi:transposase, IS5 family
LTRRRKRIGEKGLEWMLTETIKAAESTNVAKAKSYEKIIVDSTVQEKAIAGQLRKRKWTQLKLTA